MKICVNSRYHKITNLNAVNCHFIGDSCGDLIMYCCDRKRPELVLILDL